MGKWFSKEEDDWEDDNIDEVREMMQGNVDATASVIRVALYFDIKVFPGRGRIHGADYSLHNSTRLPSATNSGPKMDLFVVVCETSSGDHATKPGGPKKNCVNEPTDAGNVKVIGRTETQYGKANPSFNSPVHIEYRFEQVQELFIRLYDEESRLGMLSDQMYLGELRVHLSEIWSNNPYLGRFMNRVTNDTIAEVRINAVEIKQEKTSDEMVAVFDFVVNPQVRQRIPAPYLMISRMAAKELIPVAKTSARRVTDGKGVRWPALHVRLDRLCKGDMNMMLVLEVRHRNGLVGSCQTTLATLLSGGILEYDLVNPRRKVQDMAYTNSGILRPHSVRIDKYHSFLDFVRRGFGINLSIAIDFSRSNKPFDNERSLHYRGGRGSNASTPYHVALQAVGAVLCCYDRDQSFPMYGFGAGVRGQYQGRTPPFFPCTLDPSDVEVEGLSGISEAYWKCLDHVEPTEPTNLAPIIQETTRLCRERRQAGDSNHSYQILFIVTDGGITDMKPTIDAIVAASYEPISILIVGVGNDDFSKMETLDADREPLISSSGRQMGRDIVGFVAFEEFKDNPEMLATECLKEIPSQFTTWARSENVKIDDIEVPKSGAVVAPAVSAYNEQTRRPPRPAAAVPAAHTSAGSQTGSLPRRGGDWGGGTDLSTPLIPADHNGTIEMLSKASGSQSTNRSA